MRVLFRLKFRPVAQGEIESESGTAALSALHLYFPLKQLGLFAGDCQTQSGTAESSAQGAVPLAEGIEDKGQITLADSLACVAHPYPPPLVLPVGSGAYLDRPAFSELDCIVQNSQQKLG